MDWEQIAPRLQQAIQIAIADGMRDGFAAKEAEPVVTVNVPPLISMRDFFAGCALHGLLANPVPPDKDDIGPVSYIAADRLLQAREVKTNEADYA